jgi:hypothetical protein
MMKDIENTDSVSYKRSLLIGMLLGCANSKISATTKPLKAEFTVKHSVSQLDLAHWKATEIERLFAVKVRYTEQQKCLSFSAGRRVRIVHQWFHCGERKTITPKIRFMDHPIGLTMLLCDVGSMRRQKKQHKTGSLYYAKPSLTIAVRPFIEIEIALLLTHIKTLFGAEGYIKSAHRAKTIRFNPENSQIIWQGVRRWIPEISSMHSKFQEAILAYGK